MIDVCPGFAVSGALKNFLATHPTDQSVPPARTIPREPFVVPKHRVPSQSYNDLRITSDFVVFGCYHHRHEPIIPAYFIPISI
jgi:hypothetical protein